MMTDGPQAQEIEKTLMGTFPPRDGENLRGELEARHDRTRRTSMTDELRAIQEREGILPEESRDPDALNDFERADVEYFIERTAHRAARDPSNNKGQLIRDWDFQDEVSDEFLDHRHGMSLSQEIKLREDAHARLDTMSASDYKREKRHWDKQFNAHAKITNSSENVWAEFERRAPGLATSFDAATIRAAAAEEMDLCDMQDFTDPEKNAVFLEGLADNLKTRVEDSIADARERGAVKRADDPGEGSFLEQIKKVQEY